jgi:hypothetical protein
VSKDCCAARAKPKVSPAVCWPRLDPSGKAVVFCFLSRYKVTGKAASFAQKIYQRNDDKNGPLFGLGMADFNGSI